MDENKKYPIEGTVTISTAEYRDLLTCSVANEKEASEYRSKYWAEQNKTSKLEKSLAELKEFVQSDEDMWNAYRNHLIEKALKEADE